MSLRSRRGKSGFSEATPSKDKNDKSEKDRALRSMQMLQIGQNLTSVINSPHEYDTTQFKMPPLPPPPPELAAEAIIGVILGRFALWQQTIFVLISVALQPPYALDTGREAMRQYRKIMGPYATSYASQSRPSRSHGKAKKAEQAQQAEQELRHCLETVPDIYFKTDFSITDKQFFTSLSERKDKMVLQDNLSYYLDLVEVNLLKQICLKSSSVFAALQTIQRLHSDVAAACRQIKSIRENMKKLHDHLVLSVTNVLRSKRRKDNTKKLEEKLELVATVVAASPTVQILVSTADFANALNLISSTKRILQHDLKGVACVKGILKKLNQQEILIEKLVTTDFTKFALGKVIMDVEGGGHDKDGGGENDIKQGGAGHQGDGSGAEEVTQLQMTQLAANALKMVKLASLVGALGTSVNKHIKLVIKEVINQELERIQHEEKQAHSNGGSDATPHPPSSKNPKNNISSSSSSKKSSNATTSSGTGSSPPMAGENEVDPAFTIRRHSQILLPEDAPCCAKISISGDSSMSDVSTTMIKCKMLPVDVENDAKTATTQYQNLLSTSCEFIHGRASKILLTRKTLYKSLRLKELTQVGTFFGQFVYNLAQGEKKKKRKKKKKKKGAVEFHTKNVNQLNLCLEGEQWKQADVPREFQDLIDGGFKRRIQSVRREDGVESKISRVIFFAVHGQNGVHSGLFLKFSLVSSTLILLKMISRYIECAAELKVVGSDILTKLEALLRLFNSKTCQLVLGARAMQTAGLKNINVTHLALASQSLGLVISQVPVIRSALASHLPSKHQVLLGNFKNVSLEFKQHQEEIFKKLVDIINQLAEGRLKDVRWTNSSAEDKEDQLKVEKGIRVLMGQTKSMHTKLSRLIDQEQRNRIFSQIAAVYSTICKRYLKDPFEKGNDVIKRKISTQIQYILSHLRNLSGLGKTVCQDLEQFVV
eukprot:jgi/Bigna1/88410/estExt_fgenesh1_pg.C_310150